MSIIGKAKANKAFTLIEIMLVVLIIGIILAIAAPNFSKGYSRLVLNKTAEDLLDLSRWAQAMAIGQERAYVLSFSDDRHSYRLLRARTNEGSDNEDDLQPVSGALGHTHKVPDTVHLEMTKPYGTDTSGNANRIEFYPDGSIDAAEIRLDGQDKKIVLSSTEVRGMMTKVDSE